MWSQVVVSPGELDRKAPLLTVMAVPVEKEPNMESRQQPRWFVAVCPTCRRRLDPTATTGFACQTCAALAWLYQSARISDGLTPRELRLRRLARHRSSCACDACQHVRTVVSSAAQLHDAA